jgi:uncharacterized membrane protein (Fun14 family)
MALLTIVGGGLLLGLSYFHVVNVDFSKAQTEYSSAVTWLSDQASKLRDVAMSYLPASSSSLAGLVVGFKKK